jgi:type IV secretion system protein VirD4
MSIDRKAAQQIIKPQATRTGRVRFPPVITGVLLFALTFVAATQYVAARLNYQPALGEPWFSLGGMKFYEPLGWLRWFITYRQVQHPYLQETFKVAALVVFGGTVIAVLASMIFRHFLTRDLQIATPDLHGTARFMTADEVRNESGLVGKGTGVYVGAYYDEAKKQTIYLRHDGPEHVLTTAPTRSGKGVGLCVPTLLSWEYSAVVYDKKKELWALTAGWRQSEAHNHVIFINPTDTSGETAKFNPIEEIRVGTPYEVGDCQNIAQMIVDPDGKGMTDHWAKTGHELLSAGILHVLYAEPNKTLRGLVSFFCDPASTMEQVAEAMMSTEHDSAAQYGWLDPITNEPTKIHPMIAEAARSFLNKADNERSGVQSTAMSFLTIYRDPIIANNTSTSDFKVQDLMLSEKPVTLYIVDDPRESDRIRPFIRLLVNQLVQGNLRTLTFQEGRPIPNYKHRMLLLFDEFPALGKLEIFQTQLAYIAGYGMKAYLFIQDKEQLDDKYGDKESITSNCHVRNYYAPNKLQTAKYISEMLGTTTRLKEKVSYSGQRTKSTLDQISVSVEEVSRPLMTADEVARLRGPVKQGSQGLITKAGEMLIQVAGQRPIHGVQPLYFIDPVFSERAKIPAPAQSDRLRGLGSVPAPVVARSPAAAAAVAPAAAPPTATEPNANPADLDPDEEAAMSCPDLPDSALIEWDDYPDRAEDPAPPATELPPGVSVSEDDEVELDLGKQLVVDPNFVDDESVDEPSEDPYLAATAAWIAGTDVQSLPPLNELADAEDAESHNVENITQETHAADSSLEHTGEEAPEGDDVFDLMLSMVGGSTAHQAGQSA